VCSTGNVDLGADMFVMHQTCVVPSPYSRLTGFAALVDFARISFDHRSGVAPE
jgi:hypothetical protein